MKWKILSSEYIFHDLWFKVRKDKCETPDGDASLPAGRDLLYIAL